LSHITLWGGTMARPYLFGCSSYLPNKVELKFALM